jgi:hypothetical protein
LAAARLKAGDAGLSLTDPVTFHGVGRVQVGISGEQLQQAVGQAVVLDEDSALQDESAPEDACIFATLADYRWGISWMLIRGQVARTDVTERGFATASGIRVGDSETAVRSAYGRRVRVEPHTYVDGGHYLTIESPDRKFAAVFETDGAKVTGFRIGRLPEALYIEGCQ